LPVPAIHRRHTAQLAPGLVTLLASAQSAKVLGGLGHDVVEQLKRNTLRRLVADLDIKETAQYAAMVSKRDTAATCCAFTLSSETLIFLTERMLSASTQIHTPATTTTTIRWSNWIHRVILQADQHKQTNKQETRFGSTRFRKTETVPVIRDNEQAHTNSNKTASK
jgi:hypothetical protein